MKLRPYHSHIMPRHLHTRCFCTGVALLRRPLFVSVVLLFCCRPLVLGQDLSSFEKRISTTTLENGLTFVVCERPEAPVFSFFTRVNAGSDRDTPGVTGLAHMFEHMAFKGTDKIGTTNYASEEMALEEVRGIVEQC